MLGDFNFKQMKLYDIKGFESQNFQNAPIELKFD